MTARLLPILIGCGLVVCCTSVPVFANRGGAPPFRNGSTASSGTNCSACHASSLGHTTGSVQILNAPLEYNLNRLYDITVRVADSVQAGAGFEFSAESATGAFRGTLIITDATNTRHPTGSGGTNFITHTSTGVSNAVANWAGMGNAAQYNFRWRAPATNQGQVNFWAAGNAINNNLANSGDRVYLTNRSVLPAICDKADVNEDLLKDSLDINAFIDVVLSPNSATPRRYCASDINDDGVIDLMDAAQLVDVLLDQ